MVFDDAVFLDNESVLDHFDNIQSTNWRTIRWKPPALEAGHEAHRRVLEEGAEEGDDAFQKELDEYGPGWRVEFRPLEIQLTDFENAAFSILIVLIARSILAMGYNMYVDGGGARIGWKAYLLPNRGGACFLDRLNMFVL